MLPVLRKGASQPADVAEGGAHAGRGPGPPRCHLSTAALDLQEERRRQEELRQQCEEEEEREYRRSLRFKVRAVCLAGPMRVQHGTLAALVGSHGCVAALMRC